MTVSVLEMLIPESHEERLRLHKKPEKTRRLDVLEYRKPMVCCRQMQFLPQHLRTEIELRHGLEELPILSLLVKLYNKKRGIKESQPLKIDLSNHQT